MSEAEDGQIEELRDGEKRGGETGTPYWTLNKELDK